MTKDKKKKEKKYEEKGQGKASLNTFKSAS